MDVTMGKKTVVCYKKTFEYFDVCEGAVDLVVPDTMPDIERILCADGTLVIRSKEASVGSVTVTAEIFATVLYVPEDSSEVCRLNATIPLTITSDAPGITPESMPVAMITLSSAEARMLNPRKVVVRANSEATIECYDIQEEIYYGDIGGDSAGDVQIKRDRRSISHVVCVKEKTFVLTDEFHVAAGRPRIGQLLSYNVDLTTADKRSVGSKLVINGSAKVAMTYTVDGESDIASAEFETSFSQVIETDSGLNEPECSTSMLLTAVFIEPYTYDGGETGVSCELHIVLQLVCTDNVSVDYISDCYSNRYQLGVMSEKKKAACDMQRSVMHYNLNEQIETAQTLDEVIGVSGKIVEPKMENGFIKCKLLVAVLYKGDGGSIYSTSRRFAAELSAELGESMEAMLISSNCGQVYASFAHKSITIRAQLSFEIMKYRSETLSQVCGISFAEAQENEGDRPSLVVIRAQEDVTVWDVAKRYRSTCDIINMVNGLEADEPLSGKILLIPSVK